MTAKEVAKKFSLAQSTVTKRARRLGFERSGRDWHFTEEQALAIAQCEATPGPKPSPVSFRKTNRDIQPES